MIVLIIILIYAIIITIIMSRNPLMHNNKTNKWTIAIAYTIFVASLIVFEVSF